jgi:hypothetical protein
MTEETIRHLSFDDEHDLLSLIKTSIFHGDDLHIGDLIANDKNVSAFYQFEIFPVLMEKEPILGYIKNDQLLGFSCCSTKINKIYSLKKSLALGLITIVHPDHRRQGIGTKLRTSLGKLLDQKKIENFVFEIKQENNASLNNAKKIAEDLNAETKLISFKFIGNTNVF